ncbi:hypothetical protein FQR65_LT00731 [Abscondita terminalis]|nr:hypothetical protein FQR65_LT00731 [Abscondita terminalis]
MREQGEHRFPVSIAMATMLVAVLFPLLCFDGILSAIAYDSIPANLNSAFYNDLRQLLKLSASLHSKPFQDDNEKRSEIVKVPEPSPSYLVPQEVENWPEANLNLGQVSGVAININEEPVIFHRGDRVWDINSFDTQNNYLQRELGPISIHTVLTLNPKTGRVIQKWGKNMFYMPHGITIDHHNNMWITDVALHQAFKVMYILKLYLHYDRCLLVQFRPGKNTPDIVFGVSFEPGKDEDHLCKPTSIAVASTAEIFIADGYCNSRILKFNALGGLIRTIPSDNTGCLALAVPHHTALIESLDRICVADRENKRVVCPSAELQTNKKSTIQALTIQTPDMGRVFGIAAVDEIIYAVNGPTSIDLPIQGFIISVENETVIGVWGQEVKELSRIGGTDTSEMVKRLMYKMFTNEVGVLFSWDGAKRKLQFKKLKIANVIFNAVRSNHSTKNATDSDIIVLVKKWLVRCKDRIKNADNKKLRLDENGEERKGNT